MAHALRGAWARVAEVHQATASVAASPADANPAQSTLTVPLSLVPTVEGTRIAVDVAVAGGDYRPYLLDTGSTGLYVANLRVNPNAYTMTSRTFHQSYSSGIEYQGPVIRTSLSLAPGMTASNVYLGLITSATGNKIPDWTQKLASLQAPYEGQFYGTLGMSLKPGKAYKQGSLYSVIAQLPGKLNSGFIVHTGGSDGTSASLTIGLNSANMQGFQFIKMHPDGARGTTYAYGNGAANDVLAWDDKRSKVDYKISGMKEFKAPTVFDTGDPVTTIYTGDVPRRLVTNHQLNPNLSFDARLTPANHEKFVTGDGPGQRPVAVPGGRSIGTVNSGIGLFFAYDVAYDIKDGLIGFRPANFDATGSA